MDQIITANAPQFHNPKLSDLEKNPFDRYVSAEIEVAGMRAYDRGSTEKQAVLYNKFFGLCQKWGVNVVRDGSLPSTGFEINTAPAGGDLYIKQIKEICQFLKENDSFVDNSCGLHVHIDARDFNYTKLIKYAKVWSKVEDTMFDLIISSRKESRYCFPLKDQLIQKIDKIKNNRQAAELMIKNIYMDPYLTDVTRVKTQRRPEIRYRSINLHSWIYRGTIENRMHHGTIDVEKIVNWTMLNSAILEASCQMSNRDVESIGESDGLAFLCAISPTEELKSWIIERYKFFKKTGVGTKVFESSTPSNIEPNEL